MKILDLLKTSAVILDGGMGTLLQSAGLAPGELPELWNVSRPDEIVAIHRAYFDAGSNVVYANTFGANPLKFPPDELEKIISAALTNAKKARELSGSDKPKFVALDIGPLGRLLKPYGDLDFEDAVSAFAAVVRLGQKYGADLIAIETMNDSYETKAALLAAKENSDLPVFVTNAYGEDGKLMTGATPAAMVALLEGMHADAIGVNCSLGPKALEPVVDQYLKYASVPVIVKPNAGLPQVVDGKTVFNVDADEFSTDVINMMNKGVRVAGGCCGTTPEYISRLTAGAAVPVSEKHYTLVSSFTHAVDFEDLPVIIGERINPTGKKRFKQALAENDLDYILNEGIRQQEAGAHLLDVNVGLPEIDEPAMLERVVCELQAVTNLPLQIDTSDPVAMERAMRRYNGKAMINSVNGKKESMDAVFPLVQKYGGVVVALTLDENGIPDTAEGRVDIAKRIVAEAARYGIFPKDIVFDTLTMAVSAVPDAAQVTLSAMRAVREELGCHTSLGVSNVSFGLPQRELINGAFYTAALENGLSAAIMNPCSQEMMKSYCAFRALHGKDAGCAGYIEFASNYHTETVAAVPVATEREYASELQRAIVKGLKDQAAAITEKLLETVPPLEIVNAHLIPALDIVGDGYEKKTTFLPQLLMSAEAANAAFDKIKSLSVERAEPKCGFVIATVQGDIHDIGKNIVKLLLENYGFDVTDLGKDVPPDTVLEAVLKTRAPMLGLSALMTTTVPAMEETIKLVKEHAPWCKTVVGGAVLTQEYADMIGADKYAKDAMETVRYAEEIWRNL